jgi:chorismate synthase
MASNTFGRLFKIMTWGESHGKAIGVVIDGCPPGILLNNQLINHALSKRAPGKSPHTSPRSEPDIADIYSGVFEGKTTGMPISIIIPNLDADSSKYESTKHLLRPGHANATYLNKYGVFDYRGGGRASARETACRVAAGAVAQQILALQNIQTNTYLYQLGDIEINPENINFSDSFHGSVLQCPDQHAEKRMIEALEAAKKSGDSLGGTIAFHVDNMPHSLGDPVYEKLEANLARAMLSIPASKGFEIGKGFSATRMQGSEHNDLFSNDANRLTVTNHAGGILGGISTGMPLTGKVAFKPTSSIIKPQATVDLQSNQHTFQLPEGSRHDPCVAIRAVPVVDAMCALVLVDALLINQCIHVGKS